MKLNRLGAFTLGVIITAVSVGTVSFVNAAGDATIKACANKKTGSMRYIAKGKCKKTEKALTWNEMGPQGMPGVAGSTGTKGDTGANGQNIHLVNSAGKSLGQVVYADNYSATVLIDNHLWVVNTEVPYVTSQFMFGYYKDIACLIPFGVGGADAIGLDANPQTLAVFYGTSTTYNSTLKIFKKVGKGFSVSSQTNVYTMNGGCRALTNLEKLSADEDVSLWEISEVSTRPDFSWPMTVVAK
jgi:hypothetical protein